MNVILLDEEKDRRDRFTETRKMIGKMGGIEWSN